MEVPDVTGFTLGEALKVLEAAGITKISVRVTAPPRNITEEYSPGSRVVRLKAETNGDFLELLVCNIDYPS